MMVKLSFSTLACFSSWISVRIAILRIYSRTADFQWMQHYNFMNGAHIIATVNGIQMKCVVCGHMQGALTFHFDDLFFWRKIPDSKWWLLSRCGILHFVFRFWHVYAMRAGQAPTYLRLSHTPNGVHVQNMPCRCRHTYFMKSLLIFMNAFSVLNMSTYTKLQQQPPSRVCECASVCLQWTI